MNWDQIAGDWKQFTGKVKAKWGKLTDNDLTTIAGKRDELAGLLQVKYGYAKEQAEKELNEFAQTLKSRAFPSVVFGELLRPRAERGQASPGSSRTYL
jgi:uncharacterized protein YjbJ (UPF0337 family)